MKTIKALLGELLIYWGFTLAEAAWSDQTVRKFGEFTNALKDDAHARPIR